MIEPTTILNLLILGVLYNIMLTVIVIHAVRKWRVLLEQREQELKRCKMERKYKDELNEAHKKHSVAEEKYEKKVVELKEVRKLIKC